MLDDEQPLSLRDRLHMTAWKGERDVRDGSLLPKYYMNIFERQEFPLGELVESKGT